MLSLFIHQSTSSSPYFAEAGISINSLFQRHNKNANIRPCPKKCTVCSMGEKVPSTLIWLSNRLSSQNTPGLGWALPAFTRNRCKFIRRRTERFSVTHILFRTRFLFIIIKILSYRLYFWLSSVPVRDYLNERFEQNWMGNNGPIPWLARSPDFNRCDFYLWRKVKESAFFMPPEPQDEFEEAIELAFASLGGEKIMRTKSSFPRQL